jgi:hypothetical protein
MGRVGYKLDGLFQKADPAFIKGNGKDYGRKKTRGNRIEAYPNRVTNEPGKIVGTYKGFEILEPRPFAVPKTQAHGIVLKSYLKAIHGNVFKDDNISKGKDEEKIKLPFPVKGF